VGQHLFGSFGSVHLPSILHRQTKALQLYPTRRSWPGGYAEQAGEAAWGYYSGAIGEEVRKYAEENTGYSINPIIWKLTTPF